MTLTQILVFTAVALAIGRMIRLRGWILYAASLIAIFWLQPAMPIRNLDFWLPTVTLGLVVFVWAAVRQKRAAVPADGSAPVRPSGAGEDARAGAFLVLVVLGVAATRYLGPAASLIPSLPPDILSVLPGVALLAAVAALLLRVPARRASAWLLIAGILILFVLLKTNPLAQFLSVFLRMQTGQSTALASALDIRWLGFSYIAFRLIHTLRDFLAGRLPDLSLREFISYVVFFPVLTAGPIDRVQRFLPDLRGGAAPAASLTPATLQEGGRRVMLGAFKKFVVADSLALAALGAVDPALVASTGWMWILLYAYAFRIYFDFSGYTDIAVGLSRWMGIQSPENFDRPYLKPNLTAFWNSWHMTLAQWFRAYFFNPLTRTLRSGPRELPMALIILTGQLSTFLLIGLWHGVTWNFAIWGLWHGAGLFVHNRWGEFSRGFLAPLENRKVLRGAYTVLSTLVTFNFVALGWVWFALPDPASSVRVLLKLFGLGG